MRTQQKYSDAFRRKVAEEVLKSKDSIAEVSRRYGVPHALAGVWSRRYEEGQVTEEDYRSLKIRIGELEEVVERLAQENAFLKKFEASARSMKSVDSSIVTAKNLAASRRAVNSLGWREAATTTGAESGKDKLKATPGWKDDLKPLPPPTPGTGTDT